jgi:DNA-binding GntR family transcriptional regulator
MTANETAALARPETLRMHVERFIRDAIASGQFKPGARLVEREICEMLRISRPPLREALRALEAEKLIHIIPNKGPVVASISLQEAREVYAMRALLESYATREFTQKADDAMVRSLAAAVRELRAEAKSGERKRLLAAKTRFYQILYQGCGNRLLVEILQGLLTRINLLRATSLAQPERIAPSLAEIDGIVEAIRERNAAKAERLAREHIVNAQAAALGVLENQIAKAPTTPSRSRRSAR